MARGKARSPLERNKVIALHELGRSVSQIVTQQNESGSYNIQFQQNP